MPVNFGSFIVEFNEIWILAGCINFFDIEERPRKL